MNRGESGDHEIANLLGAWRTGDAGAYQKLIPLVYDHLRRIAGGVTNQWGVQGTQGTAIVHELYLKLVDSSAQNYENRVHFFSTAARAMR